MQTFQFYHLMQLIVLINLSFFIRSLKPFQYSSLNYCNSIVLAMDLKELGSIVLRLELLRLSLVKCCGSRMKRQLLIIYRFPGLAMLRILLILRSFQLIINRVNILGEKLLSLQEKLFLDFEHNIYIYIFLIIIIYTLIIFIIKIIIILHIIFIILLL